MVFEEYFLLVAQQTGIAITNSMTFKVIVSDLEPNNNITEAAFDFFRVEDALGITENTDEFNLFPNPATDEISIVGAVVGSTYDIISIKGLILETGVVKSEEHSINLKQMSSGIYFVSINGIQKKIIKQ